MMGLDVGLGSGFWAVGEMSGGVFGGLHISY
jgi:hypothetical protein